MIRRAALLITTVTLTLLLGACSKNQETADAGNGKQAPAAEPARMQDGLLDFAAPRIDGAISSEPLIDRATTIPHDCRDNSSIVTVQPIQIKELREFFS